MVRRVRVHLALQGVLVVLQVQLHQKVQVHLIPQVNLTVLLVLVLQLYRVLQIVLETLALLSPLVHHGYPEALEIPAVLVVQLNQVLLVIQQVHGSLVFLVDPNERTDISVIQRTTLQLLSTYYAEALMYKINVDYN